MLKTGVMVLACLSKTTIKKEEKMKYLLNQLELNKVSGGTCRCVCAPRDGSRHIDIGSKQNQQVCLSDCNLKGAVIDSCVEEPWCNLL